MSDAILGISAYYHDSATVLLVDGEIVAAAQEERFTRDIYRCFMRTEMDYLVMGDHLFDKREQPEFPDDETWKNRFTLD